MFNVTTDADTIRLLYATTGIIAFGLLMWRIVGTWPDLPRLGHALGILLSLSLLFSALATWRAGVLNAPFNEVIWLLWLHRIACIVLALRWRHWLEMRLSSPYQRVSGNPL